jgi:hypothetical protein
VIVSFASSVASSLDDGSLTAKALGTCCCSDRSSDACLGLQSRPTTTATLLPCRCADIDSDIAFKQLCRRQFRHRCRQQIPTSIPTALPTAIPTSLLTAFPTAIPTSLPTTLLFQQCSPQLADNGADSASVTVAIICPDVPDSASIVVAILRPDVRAYTYLDRHPDVSDISHAIGDASIHTD